MQRLAVPQLDDRIRHLQELSASRHATDPEPVGPVRDVELWRQGQWRRAIPRRFHDAAMPDVEARHGQEAHDALRGWLGRVDERPNLLLFGPVGVGKTHAAVATVRVLHERGATVAFWPVTSLLEATSPGGQDPAAALASAVEAEVLVLDDLGAERDTEWAAERVYEVVNRRWLEQVPTIVTSNAPGPEGLQEAVGERVWSRLQHEAVGVRLVGHDQRRKRPK